MCVIEQRTYVDASGSRSVVEVPHFCKYARGNHTCSRTTTERSEVRLASPPQLPSLRDDAPSPVSLNPPTPPTGTILIQERRPASIEHRPSTRDGERRRRYIEPKIIFDFGSKKRDKKYKRLSLGAASIASSTEVHLDSPRSSGASYSPIRTGFPEAPLPPPTTTSSGYMTFNIQPTAPSSGHHRHTSSTSSYTTSAYAPSIYARSEPESPSRRRSYRNPVSIHNPTTTSTHQTTASPLSPTAPPSPFRTTLVTPRHNETPFPTDYSEFHAPPLDATDRAPEILDRDTERERQRRQQQDEQRNRDKKRQQEEDDRRLAETIAAEDEARKLAETIAEDERQARIERGRYAAREEIRNENKFAEAEKARAEEREEARRVKRREQDAADANARESERTRPSTAESRGGSGGGRDRLAEEVLRRKRQADELRRNTERNRTTVREPPSDNDKSKRRSKLDVEIESRERELLLQETAQIMEAERVAAQAREREERDVELRRRQMTSEYWDPRGGSRFAVPETSIRRRNSISSRRESTSGARSGVGGIAGIGSGLGRATSRRVSVHQPLPPLAPLNTSNPAGYSTRPASMSFSPLSPPPPPRSSTSPRSSTTTATGSLARRETIRERGERVIAEERARAEAEERVRARGRELRDITAGVGGLTVDFKDGGEEEGEEDRIAGFGPRLGLGRKGRRGPSGL